MPKDKTHNKWKIKLKSIESANRLPAFFGPLGWAFSPHPLEHFDWTNHWFIMRSLFLENECCGRLQTRNLIIFVSVVFGKDRIKPPKSQPSTYAYMHGYVKSNT